MKKILLSMAAALTMASTVQAGGYVTNTNHNAAFLRNPAQEAKIDINALYPNPAGIGFLDKGWHLSLNIQSAFQHRDVTSNFGQQPGYFTLGTVNSQRNATGEKEFKGRAKAPVIPALDVGYVHDRWSAMFHFALGGGGGKCDFEDGLGSFESIGAMLPVALNGIAQSMSNGQVGTAANPIVDGYSLNSWMKGRQYYYGFQLQGGYKVLDNLNVSAGLRGVYATCFYEGYMGDLAVHTTQAAAALGLPAGQNVPAQALVQNLPLPAATAAAASALVQNRSLEVDQSGFGLTPVLGVDWRINDQWNVAAKYEFKTRLRLKNDTHVNTTGLPAYDDGVKQAADIPALLTLGAQFNPLRNLHLNVGAHIYFDKQASQYDASTGTNTKQEKLNGQTWEILAGVEWDIEDWVTVSAGWQTTNYGLGDNSQYISDMSFVTNSNSIGLGARFNISKVVAIDVAYFKTLYKHYRVDYEDYNGLGARLGQALGTPDLKIPGYNDFYRTNDVFGVGVNVKF